MYLKPRHLSLILIASLLAMPASAKLYRWVDENGQVHYTDKLPPKQTDKARTEMNKRGMQIRKIDRAKSKEEIAREKELERLRIEQQKIIEKQKAEDRVLLRTFRSEDDIVMAQDGKLNAIDVMIQISVSNIKQMKAQLVNLQNRAANQERRGKKPHESLIQEIANSRQNLKESYASIINREKDKEKIRQKTADDLKRFRELKKLKLDQTQKAEMKAIQSQLDYVVVCQNTKICDYYWKKAKEYALKHATTKIKILAESVILTAAPVVDKDISITLSRIKRKDAEGEHLFFDLQCKQSTKGLQFCASDKVANVRSGFRSLLLGKKSNKN